MEDSPTKQNGISKNAATIICGLFFKEAYKVDIMKKTVPINENRHFLRLYRHGKSHVTPNLVLYTKKNRLNYNRLGITATKKIGNAVERNRAKRVIKEAYRLLEPELPTGIDFVIVARRKAVFSKMQAVMQALKVALAVSNRH